MGVRLIAPNGARVEVTSEKAERLLGHGFRQEGSGDGTTRGNASREEWAAYADSLGVEYAEDAKRGDIKAAVEAAAAQ